MKLLLTGATGKVGQNFLPRFLSEDMEQQVVGEAGEGHLRPGKRTRRVSIVWS